MPHLNKDLVDGLKVGRRDGKWFMSQRYEATGLTGANVKEMLAQALDLTATGTAHTGDNLPVDGEEDTFGTKKVYANHFDVEPWGVNDAYVTVTWTDKKRGNFDVVGFGPVVKEVGATVEEIQTDFDYANLLLPLAQRQRIQVSYDELVEGPPTGTAKVIDATGVRRFHGRAVLNFTREQTVDPETMAPLYVAFTNLNTWRGYPRGTVLCLSIIGRNAGDGIWSTSYSFAVDRLGFKQYARYTVPETGHAPRLSVAQIAGQNGITEVVVQGEVDFSGMQLPGSFTWPGWIIP
jgi:hypothetical protein